MNFETGERIDLSDYKPRPAGWEEFKGWSLSEKGTELLPQKYTVTDSVTLYAIWSRKIKDADVKISPRSYTYNGKARTPAVTVYYENRILKQGTDYTVSYSNNTKAGKATVKITGKGSYEGSTSGKFTINKAPQKLTLSAAASSVSVGKTVKMKAAGAKETKNILIKHQTAVSPPFLLPESSRRKKSGKSGSRFLLRRRRIISREAAMLPLKLFPARQRS